MEKGKKSYHLLDRHLGIPLTFLLGLVRNRWKKKPTDIRKIAVVNLFSIGDNVLMSAAIADLAAAYPRAELVAFTAKNNHQLVKLIPGFTEIHKLPIASPLQTIKLIRSKGRFDIVFDFGSWPRISSLYTFFVKARWKTGFRSHGQFRHYIYDQKVNYSSSIHEVDNYRTLIKDFCYHPPHPPKINYTATPKVRDFIEMAGKYCIIHPWPGGYKSHLKQWDNRRWAEMVQKIDKHFDHIVLTGAPGDIEKSQELESLILDSHPGCKLINASGMFNLGETAYLLNKASFIISIDTGISHISASFNKPMICLQGPASSIRWRPYSDNAVVINPDRGTFGYLSFGFEYHKAKEDCMENISVDAVYQAFMRYPGHHGLRTTGVSLLSPPAHSR
ncbi:MAG: hypothetical protein BGO55_20065 [Sphingobacteriales bacterium 50-39]|nr:glycosyltransferase family 9 protein [Sphingobacteriales bacterium]OJW58998.1 MAG: hypothetical protein BGO55_20065 [Sphingobacteriales bacterium 50-39]